MRKFLGVSLMVLICPAVGVSGGTADAHGSGPCTRKGVGVQIPSRAPKLFLFRRCCLFSAFATAFNAHGLLLSHLIPRLKNENDQGLSIFRSEGGREPGKGKGGQHKAEVSKGNVVVTRNQEKIENDSCQPPGDYIGSDSRDE